VARKLSNTDLFALRAMPYLVNVADVKRLFVHIDALDEEAKTAKEHIDRLTGNVAQLSKELAEAREAKKVVLPREVAEAIDYGRQQNRTNHDLLVRSIHSAWGSHTPLARLSLYCRNGNQFKLAAALVNGYTVEELEEAPTTEDKLRARFKSELERFATEAGIPIESLAAVLVVEARRVIAEERQQTESQ